MGIEPKSLSGLGDSSFLNTAENILQGGISAGVQSVAGANKSELENQASAAVTTATSNFWQQYKWVFLLGGMLAILFLGIIGYAIWATGVKHESVKE